MALPPRLFCDTSFFYACFDPSDTNHERAKAIVVEVANAKIGLWVTWDIISETATLLRYRRNFQAALTFLAEIKPRLQIITYGDRVRDEAEQIFRRYGQDRRLSFCDAISLVVVTTLLDDVPCLTFDEDFRRLGLTVIP